MIENLIQSALGDKGAELLGGLNLSPDVQNKALDLAKGSVMDGLKDSMMSGNISNITQAFSGGTSSSLVQNIISKYGSSLISKLGLSESVASTISTTVIPMIFSYINKKDDAPTDSDAGVKDMLGDLVSGGIQDKIGGFLKGKFKF